VTRRRADWPPRPRRNLARIVRDPRPAASAPSAVARDTGAATLPTTSWQPRNSAYTSQASRHR
jgi:hypothetical protein